MQNEFIFLGRARDRLRRCPAQHPVRPVLRVRSAEGERPERVGQRRRRRVLQVQEDEEELEHTSWIFNGNCATQSSRHD